MSEAELTAPTTFEPLKLTVSLTQKVNLGQYESADCSLFVSNVTIFTTEEEMAALIEQGHVVYRLMGERLHGMVKEARRGKGWGILGEDESPPSEEDVPFEQPSQGFRERAGLPPAPAKSNSSVATTPRRQAAASKAVVCENCGNECWDNREKIASGKFNARSPHYSCKDRENCGFAAWPDEKNGGLRWSGPK